MIRNRRQRVFPVAMAALCLGAAPALAGTHYETVVTSCEELPKIEERNIINGRGDQSELKANESFVYEYHYRQRDHVKLFLTDAEGTTSVEEFDRVFNKTNWFRGDTVPAVKRLSEAFLRGHQLFVCSAEARAR